MKELLFGWLGKKIIELTLIDYMVFLFEFGIFMIILVVLIGFLVCKIDDIKFKKKWGIK